MPRIVVRLLVRAVFFSIVALPGAIHAQSLPELEVAGGPSVTGTTSSPNIHVDRLLQPLIDKLLQQSPTLRRQWQAIAAARLVRVSLVSTPLLRESLSTRARTEVSHYAFGAIRAVVELPSAVDITELLPHELEHVLEQIEGLDLPALAKDGESGVEEVGRGVYETARARNAGFEALREVYGETDRAFAAALRGVQRALRSLFPEGNVAADTAPPPGAAPRQRRRPAVPGGHPAHKQ